MGSRLTLTWLTCVALGCGAGPEAGRGPRTQEGGPSVSAPMGAAPIVARPGRGDETVAPQQPGRRVPVPADTADRGVSLPQAPGSLAPAHVTVHGAGLPLGPDAIAELGRTEDCAGCHPDAAEHWATSAHARSSFDNPFYRASVERFRAARGALASRFCSSCHDPALLLSGAIDQPEVLASPVASVGIPCRLCHGVTEARADGNGSFVWSAEPIPLPDPAVPAQVERHRARVASDVLRSQALCGSCHRSFMGEEMGNGHHFAGVDDLDAFATSGFAGAHGDSLDADPEETTCRGCHMPRVPAPRDMAAENGTLASHRFAGSHLALTDVRAQHEAVRARLADVVRVDIPAGRVDGQLRLPLDGAAVRSGSRLALDVVVRNLGVGHRFPGGTRDLQDTFLELRLTDASGRPVAEAGTEHERTGDDPTAFVFRAVPLDSNGLPEQMHDAHAFEVGGYDRSIAARDATVVRYEVTLPPIARDAWPLRVEAKLRYRRHPLAFAQMACDTSRTPAGRAFAALRSTRVDPCVAEPVVDLAFARVYVGRGSRGMAGEGGASAHVAARLFEHALGLSHELQEHLDDVRPSVAAALRATDPGDTRMRAALHVLQARVLGAQGRTEEALREVSVAEALLPDHPSTSRARGRAYAQVWRWPEAARAFGDVVRSSPGDTVALREWTRALGSAGEDPAALTAARRGLALLPRDADMLRTQSLSLPAGHPHGSAAREASLTYRVHDDASRLLRACQGADATCARDRLPVPRVRMRVR